MDVVKQFNSGEDAAIGLTYVSLKRNAEIVKLSNFIECRDQREGIKEKVRTSEKELPICVVSEGPPKKKGKLELAETTAKCFWDLGSLLARIC